MKPNPIAVVLLGCLAVLGLLGSNNAAASSLQYQVIQSLGKKEGTPYGKLVQGSDGYFYGTTVYGGSNGAGTVFKINSSGNFTVLHEFDGADGGANPHAGLIQGSDGNFYGTAGGGSQEAGIIFKINSSGNFSALHEFDETAGGAGPSGCLIEANDGNFYGATFSGGGSGYGTVFRVNKSGNFSVLHEFGPDYTYGLNPNGLVQGSDGNLYGTTSNGGAYQYGTVFKLDLTGSHTVLHDFEASTYGDFTSGAYPTGCPIQASDGSFYGTTYSSNSFDPTSTVYKIDADGNFTDLPGIGSTIDGGLIQAGDGNFYITAYAAGSADNYGWLYKMDLAGNVTLLHEFIDRNEGANPYAPLVQGSDGRLYGTTADGGRLGSGTVFQLDLSGNFQLLHEFEGTLIYEPNDLIQARDGSFYGTTPSSYGYYHFGSYDSFGTLFEWDSSGNPTALHAFDGFIDGAFPSSVTQGSDGSLYVVTAGGWLDYWFTEYVTSTVFKIDPNGNFITLHAFDANAEGASIYGRLIQASDGSLYGTTADGGSSGSGTVFKLDSSTGNLDVVHEFDGAASGANPYVGLMIGSDRNFYGTTVNGGSSGAGIVYKLDRSGNFSVLHEFDGAGGGSHPKTPLIQDSEGNIYGTTEAGGSHNAGIVYKLDFSGNFSVLYEFNESQGASYLTSFVRGNDGNFYGTTTFGGNYGILFQIDASGNFTTVHTFARNQTDGGHPTKLFLTNDGNFYGITRFGGQYDGGVIFRLAENAQPVANAGPDQTVYAGNPVTLDGTASSDPDNGPSSLAYSWTQSSGPAVTLTGADSAQPSFTPEIAGTYVFSLVVNDGDVSSTADSVTVTVKDSSSTNTAPTARAGSDQTVNAGSLVTLNGSTSSDQDNGPSPLTYRWTQTNGPAVTLSGATTARPTFTPFEPGIYGFSLVVNDGELSSAADSVTVTVKDADYVLIQSPNGGEVWNEKSKQTITWISHNLDPNLRLVLYLSIDNGQTWTRIASPKNSGSKSWKIPKNRYVSKEALFKVCVKQDGSLCDVSDAVFTINKAPKAEAGKRQKVTVGTEVRLDGSASFDADNGPSALTFQWTQLRGPAVTLNGANTATPSFTPTVKGVYKFGLIVNDGAIDSKADKVAVQVKKNP